MDPLELKGFLLWPASPLKGGCLGPWGDQFPFYDLMYSRRTPCFFPQKEFPEIIGGSNKSLALQLIQSILVSELDSPLRSIHFTKLLGHTQG